MSQITLSQKYKKKPRLKIRELGDELMVMDPKGERLHSLNETSAFIWKWATPKHSLEDVLAKMMEVYQVSPAQAKKDLLQTVGTLQKLGLLAEVK
jgi:hypothetical protein